MEKFDFNVPIIATIIFDDSDDETKPSIDDLPVQEEASKQNPVEDATFCVDKVNKNPSHTETLQSYNFMQYDLENAENKVDQSSKKTVGNLRNLKCVRKSLDMPSLEENITSQNVNSSNIGHINNEETNLSTKTFYETISTKIMSSNDNIITKRKRTIDDCNLNVTGKKAKVQERSLPTQLYHPNEINHVISDCNGNKITDQNLFEQHSYTTTSNASIQEVNPSLNNGGTLLNILQNDNTDPTNHFEYRINIEINKNVTQEFNKQLNSDHSVTQLSHEVNETVAAYLRESLEALSEHMIHIMHVFQIYMTIYRINIDRNIIEQARNSFIKNKEYYFDLSYSTIENIIIPREKDFEFIKNFLSDTIRLAQSKSYAFTNSHMEPLLVEMIVWVKKRKVQNMNVNKISSPTLLRHLRRRVTVPKNKSSIDPPPYPNIEYPLHTPSKETNKPYVSPIDQTEKISNSTYLIYQNGSEPPCCSTGNPCGNTIATLPQNTPTIRDFYESRTAHLQPQKTTSYNYNLSSPYNQVQNISPLVTNNVQNIDSLLVNKATALWQQETSPWHHNKTIPLQKNIPLTQNNPEQQQQYIMLNSNYLQHDNPPQVTNNNEPTRSSVSRDSGFISPLHFNSNSDQLYNLQENERSPMTPVITHVTSLNPNVSYIMDGECTVCGKTTKKKCIGCYKCYYCSHDCQSKDWRYHMPNCSMRREVPDG